MLKHLQQTLSLALVGSAQALSALSPGPATNLVLVQPLGVTAWRWRALIHLRVCSSLITLN